jgi:GT2 family glycosyltransferase
VTRASIEVLIPHWNQADRLARALDSLAAQTLRADVCVVDNGSSDETPAVLAARPWVRVVRLDENLGFGAAVNRGARSSSAELIVLMNNDAVADPRFIAEIAAVHQATRAESIAACLRDPTGRVESMGVELDTSLVTYDHLHGLEYELVVRGSPRPPLAPCAGAAAYRREAMLRAGAFDEAIFAYLEDVDLGLRMRSLGMRCAIAPRAYVWHEHSATLGPRSSAKNELLGWSSRYLIWKYGACLTPRERARRRVVEGVVAVGKAATDRNVATLRGWWRAARELRGRAATPVPGSWDAVPLLSISLSESLRRRLARRAGRPRDPG